MDKPQEPPAAADPGPPKASRVTTIILIVSLVLIVLIAGVLGTVAVLMTQAPDAPLIGGDPPQRLSTPIHFAPVRETRAAPCPGEQAALDEAQTTCYLLEDGVTVNAVQAVEAVRERDGTYSVRVAVAPAYKQKLVDLLDEQVTDQRQIAVVLVPRTVVAAPIVTQSMDGDSLRIAGMTQQEAETLATRLLGDAAPPPSSPPSSPPGTGDPAPSNSATDPTTIGTADPTGTGAPTGAGTRTPDQRFASCQEATAAGFGPYTRGTHEEYAWYVDVDGNGVACNSGDLR
ncbi:excalibur calcium-binding domain-containing protein [Nonomuraea sp. MCN248]|uniref:Excalibur calcium-binding domain-containing protein n=1 Tax=Nonomuraea corallina TaxID=2989783 RepID=A0ABT4SKP0_9ACTN|nr:excalibur calcium-binding domain-containing protein [Nonomuraea corallina]MDA0637793.1 excalibur calcium-binding domain-containing protein [Nonomuraea corallina]